MTLWTAIFWFGLLAVAGLFAVGLGFLFAPTWTLSVVDHSAEKLPQVMGGRYLFFGAVLLAGLLMGDRRILAGLLFAFAAVAFIDAAIYLGEQAAPHAAVGVLCCGIGFLVYRMKEEAEL